MKSYIHRMESTIQNTKNKEDKSSDLATAYIQNKNSFKQTNRESVGWNPRILKEMYLGERILCFKSISSKLESQSTVILNNIQNQFVFCLNLNDSISISLCGEKKCKLERYEVLATYQSGKKIIMNFEKENKHDFLIITVEPNLFFSFLEKSDSSDFSFFNNNHCICHLGNYNLCDLETIKKLYNSKCEMDIIGHIFLLLSSIVKQCEVENKKENNDSFCAEEWEIENIHKVTEAIKEDPSSFDSVQSISKKTGVCISRLQQIFKKMYGVTVGVFIRESRLEEAEQLLQDKENNITDIVYKTGFSSKSYFSKIFKEKYHFSPTDYRKRILNFIKKGFH